LGSLQVRLFLTYLVIIGVTLGLATLSLFLLFGGYRDGITYSNLEVIAPVVRAQANSQIGPVKAAHDESSPVSVSTQLLNDIRDLIGAGSTSGAGDDVAIALVNRTGQVLPGAYAGPYNLNGAALDGLPQSETAEVVDITPRRCRLHPRNGPSLLCVTMAIADINRTGDFGADAVALVIAEPESSLSDVVGDLMPRLLSSGFIGLAAALVLGFLLSRSVAAPLRGIAGAARNVARGNYRSRVPATGPTEVRDLAANFNRMTEEVQRGQQTLRDFLANISHELKTPLTSIRGFSQAMLDGTIDDPAGLQRSARIISDESGRVLRLVEELLDLSRIESGQVSMEREPLDLDELFAHLDELFALRGEEAQVRLDVSRTNAATVVGDFDRLEQVLNNLLENAFQHTPPGGVIRLSSRDLQPGVVQVTVSDTGGGIAADDVPHLFERFYRANVPGERRNGARKGYGLGLAISREIVRAHGGEIWATSEVGRGTTFVFTLPTQAQPQSPAAAR
jgi:signal transduction histidine kinase